MNKEIILICVVILVVVGCQPKQQDYVKNSYEYHTTNLTVDDIGLVPQLCAEKLKHNFNSNDTIECGLEYIQPAVIGRFKQNDTSVPIDNKIIYGCFCRKEIK